MNRRKIGNEYERIAADFLEKRGYRLIERNFACRQGEIDLIAQKEEYLVFVEVKYRSGMSGGSPQEAVNAKKQARIVRSAQYYCMKRGISPDTPMRFDVVSILGEKITLYENAFFAS